MTINQSVTDDNNNDNINTNYNKDTVVISRCFGIAKVIQETSGNNWNIVFHNHDALQYFINKA